MRRSKLKFQTKRDYPKAKANKTGSKYFYQAFLNIKNQAKGLLYKLRTITTYKRLRNATYLEGSQTCN